MEEVIKEKHAENKMGTMPVGKLLITMAVPMILSMLVQALYNIVDSMFVGWMNQEALSAVSLAFSLQNFMIAVGAGTGVGLNAFLSKSLGEKDFRSANRVANNAIYFWLISYLIFLVIGLTMVPAYFRTLSNNEQIVAYGVDYMSVVLCCSFGLFGQMFTERLLTSTGRTLYSMIIQITGAVINMILDPIMIFGYLGCPAMGVKGAAIATCIGQCSACILGIILNLKVNKDIKFSKEYMKPDLWIIKRVYAVGIPSIVMGSIGSVMNFGINQIIKTFVEVADAGVAVFGVYYKLQSFVFMPVFGLNNGIVPIIAYNYGARNRERIIKTLKLALVVALCFMAIGFVSFETIPDVLLSIFESKGANSAAENAALVEIGVPALRIIAVHYLIAGFCIVLGSTFQALGKAVFSMVVSLMRQMVVLLPAAYLLSLTGELQNIWWAFPMAECMSLIVTCFFFFTVVMKIINFEKIDDKFYEG